MTSESVSKPLAQIKFAVCLAAFNGFSWVQDQIDSILMQSNVSVTIFVSVDCSSDNTEALIDKIAENDGRVVVLKHGRYFGGAAKNFFRILNAIDFSDFDYVCLADQDDVWLSDKLIRAHLQLQASNADAYSSNVLAFWPSGRRALITKSQPQQRWDFLFEAAGPGCTYVVTRELICAIQVLLKNRWADVQQVGLHDWFIYAFARANGYRWLIDDYVGMLYRQHERNQVGVNQGWKALLHRAGKIFSGWGLTQSALIAELVGLGNDPFVKWWSGGGRLGLLWLACHSWQCRRRLRDKLLFALSCVALCFAGNRLS